MKMYLMSKGLWTFVERKTITNDEEGLGSQQAYCNGVTLLQQLTRRALEVRELKTKKRKD
jgi:hypothetical protein